MLLPAQCVRGQALLDAWFPLWPLVFQPALGVLMLGAVRSPSLHTFITWPEAPFSGEIDGSMSHGPTICGCYLASDVQGPCSLLGGFTHDACPACMHGGRHAHTCISLCHLSVLWVQLVSGAVGWARENSGGG